MQVSVLDFGAVGDGVHDDYAAIQKALDSGAEEILIPQGVYCVSQTLKVKSNTCILAEKTAKICMKSLCRRTRNEFLLSNEDTQNGNENITIIGGIWDGINTLPENQKPDLFDKNGYSVCAVYHPAALLRDPRKKDEMLVDMMAIKERIEREEN